MAAACVCDCIISVCIVSHTPSSKTTPRGSLSFFSPPPPPPPLFFFFFKFPLILPLCFVECSPLSSMRSPAYIWKGLFSVYSRGAGIAQWLELRTRDWKVAGSNPCWNGGRIFFSGVDFLCWLLFRYPFHPRVTTVARKKSRSFCQKCRWQVTAKHAYTLRMWILLNRASALVTTCP